MKKYFVDTCVWRDFYEDRQSTDKSKIGSHASKFIKNILDKRHTILINKYILYELKNKYTDEEINELLMFFKYLNILENVEISNSEYNETKIISKNKNLPIVDCIIAIQSRNYDAIVITRDNHFLKKLSYICKAELPESI